MLREYYIGRKGTYHKKEVVILSVYYDKIEYEDFGLDFSKLEVGIYYEDGTKKYEKLKGNLIKRFLELK